MRLGNLHRSYAGFTPNLAPFLEAWFRADTSVTYDGSDNVSAVANLAGQTGRNLVQASGAAQPLRVAGDNATHHRDTILFNGSSHYLKTASFTFTSPCTFYLAFRPVSIINFSRFFDGNTGNTAGCYQTSTNRWALASNTDVAMTEAIPVSADYMSIAAFVFDGANSSIDSGNRTGGCQTIGTLNPSGITLGARGNNGNPSNIQFGEMLAFSVAHSARQRKVIRNYLNAQWGPQQ